MRPSVRIVGETLNILILYNLVQESLNMKDKHDRVTNIETEVEDQNKLIELQDNSKNDKDKEDNK